MEMLQKTIMSADAQEGIKAFKEKKNSYMERQIKNMAQNKLILSAALTGAATNRSHCPYIPFTPKELGEEAKRADAGASIVHIHAREDDGTPSWRTEVFEQIQDEVRMRCPDVIINYSTGAIGMTAAERTNTYMQLNQTWLHLIWAA